jgi:molybdopterin molybdotransferase/putative molybdopterin biosynthesis protein
MKIQNQLAAVRKGRGISAAALARRVGVGRQTIYAMEAGTYVPNTAVALRLARALEVMVEDLFSLPAERGPAAEAVAADLLAAGPAAKGQPVRLGRIGPRWVGVPVGASPYYLPEADGVVSRSARTSGKADLLVFSKDEAYQKRLVLAGCDPATGLLARLVEKSSGVEVVTAAASSVLALDWLKQGKVHVAGSHLEDAATGEFNLPFLRREFPGEDLTVITFARWEEGLVIARGNPKGIRKTGDLGRKNVVFTNRERGSGSRALLDRLLRDADLPAARVRGYDRVAAGHLAAAYAVLAGEADCCLATRSAAQIFGLDFVSLHSERYDFVMRRQAMDLPAVQALLDVLQRATLRRKLEMLAGYDTTETGAVVPGRTACPDSRSAG